MTFGTMEWRWDTEEEDVDEDAINKAIEIEIRSSGRESGSGTLDLDNEEGYSYEVYYAFDHVFSGYNSAESFEAINIEIREMPQLSARDVELAKMIATYYQEMEELFESGELTKAIKKEFDEAIENIFSQMSPEAQSPLGAETFEAPYVGSDALMDISKNTDLSSFTTSELTKSSAIHGDFDTASLDYSGHQNLEVRCETFDAEEMMIPRWTPEGVIMTPVSDAYGAFYGADGRPIMLISKVSRESMTDEDWEEAKKEIEESQNSTFKIGIPEYFRAERNAEDEWSEDFSGTTTYYTTYIPTPELPDIKCKECGDSMYVDSLEYNGDDCEIIYACSCKYVAPTCNECGVSISSWACGAGEGLCPMHSTCQKPKCVESRANLGIASDGKAYPKRDMSIYGRGSEPNKDAECFGAESPSATIPSWATPLATVIGFGLGFLGIRELKRRA